MRRGIHSSLPSRTENSSGDIEGLLGHGECAPLGNYRKSEFRLGRQTPAYLTCHLAHHSLGPGRRLGHCETKGHEQVFIMFSGGVESCLPLITLLDVDQVALRRSSLVVAPRNSKAEEMRESG